MRLALFAFVLLLFSCASGDTMKYSNQQESSDIDQGVEDPSIAVDLTTYLKGFAGLYVSGQGPGASIYVRGINSMSGRNEPLMILDGLQIGSYADLHGMISSANIKRIEVLKNPEDLVIYGHRGANGVVKITSKKE